MGANDDSLMRFAYRMDKHAVAKKGKTASQIRKEAYLMLRRDVEAQNLSRKRRIKYSEIVLNNDLNTYM